MLKVGAIPNYNNQASFSGKFISTSELDIAKKYATEKDLAKFNKLVTKMQKVNDNKVYKLTKIKMISDSQINPCLVLYCRNLENFRLKQNLINNADAAKSEKNIYDGTLSRINEILSQRYFI